MKITNKNFEGEQIELRRHMRPVYTVFYEFEDRKRQKTFTSIRGAKKFATMIYVQTKFGITNEDSRLPKRKYCDELNAAAKELFGERHRKTTKCRICNHEYYGYELQSERVIRDSVFPCGHKQGYG